MENWLEYAMAEPDPKYLCGLGLWLKDTTYTSFFFILANPVEGQIARMSGKSVNASIIDLISDEETKESMFRKIAEIEKRIVATKKTFALLDQTEWMLRKE
ncbi:hypothetical protein H5410_015977 [Solanum commersonii]|uniref:Uncharacterized protein n=1 Tax=Solanum commersonii TaxID=4109 RepID=A0A9J5ZV75_SOLCO|nr:hypothetical protein H5410_015977 [Solanum commersonii]